jgi:cell division septation protein DedD
MDQFNVPHQKVKEKSVYLLHLDTARIILISAAVIGIIVVSFLLGMNFIKGGDGAKTLVTKNDIFDSQKELDLLKNNIPAPPDEDDLSKPMDEKPASPGKDERGTGEKIEPDKNSSKAKNEVKLTASKNDSSELLTGDNINEAAVKEKEVKKKAAVDPGNSRKVTRSDDMAADEKVVKKSSARNASKKKKNAKSKIVAVSGDSTEVRKAGRSGNYTIQVASFDKKSRALSEVNALKELKYDAYVDESRVKGKQYFRVRIGPLASKKRALDLLKTVQENEKYGESYMVKEERTPWIMLNRKLVFFP